MDESSDTIRYGRSSNKFAMLALVWRIDQSESLHKQNLVMRRSLQDRTGEGVVLTSLGHVAQQRGQLGGGPLAAAMIRGEESSQCYATEHSAV
jgi:hypothetical protein